MPLFSSNKNNQNDGTLNTNNGANTASTTRQNEYDQEPNRSDYAYDNNNMSGGAGQQTGGIRNNERGQGMNQGYNDTGNEFGETRAERRAERNEEMPMGGQTGGQHHHHHHGGAGVNPSANPDTGVGAGTYTGMGTGSGTGTGGGGGGFISQSHSDQLGRDADVRRQERGNEFGRGGAGNTDEYNAMGFDSPPSNNNNNNYGSGNNNNMTSPTGTGMGMGGGTGTGTGSVPHNSMSLKEQAEQKARESEAMQKQSVEVGKAEQLEKQAMAARQRAVEHGAHPLHGQAGGFEAGGRGGNQA